jgi:hypothetical protein
VVREEKMKKAPVSFGASLLCGVLFSISLANVALAEDPKAVAS